MGQHVVAILATQADGQGLLCETPDILPGYFGSCIDLENRVEVLVKVFQANKGFPSLMNIAVNPKGIPKEQLGINDQ